MKTGWFKNVLESAQIRINVPDNSEHADEQVYWLADFWAIAEAAVHESTESGQNGYHVYFATTLVLIYEQTNSKEDISKCCSKIHGFIKSTYPDMAPTFGNLLSTKQDIYTDTENLLNRRISKLITPRHNAFWSSFYNSSQIFIDLYLFRLYCFTEVDSVISEYLRNQKDELSFIILCMIAAAANANKKLELQEVKLFNLFLGHTFLSEERKKAANQFLENGSNLNQIDLSEFDSWAVRKFLLELAMATTWSDGVLDKDEENFIVELARKLKLTDKDVDSSFVRVESFLLVHNKNEFEVIEGYLSSRVKQILIAHKQEIIRSFKSDSKLRTSLKQASIQSLNKTAKAQLSQAVMNQLQSLPVFRGIRFQDMNWTYEKLLKILPKDVVRSVMH
ncbi:MAG: hypothetical protein AAGF85_12535 [Bacteroidota bacterium]